MKIEKYNNAARYILTPKIGYGLGDELKLAGYWVGVVSNKPQVAGVALRKLYDSCSEDDDQNVDLVVNNLISDEVIADQSPAWWKLESDSDVAASS